MQSNLSRFYTTRCNVYRRSHDEDKYGGTTDEWVKMEWCILCRLYSEQSVASAGADGYMIDVQGKKYPVTTKLLCDLDVDLQVGDKIQTEEDYYLVLRTTSRYAMNKEHHRVGLLTRLEA